jgi:hypothetical protein
MPQDARRRTNVIPPDPYPFAAKPNRPTWQQTSVSAIGRKTCGRTVAPNAAGTRHVAPQTQNAAHRPPYLHEPRFRAKITAKVGADLQRFRCEAKPNTERKIYTAELLAKPRIRAHFTQASKRPAKAKPRKHSAKRRVFLARPLAHLAVGRTATLPITWLGSNTVVRITLLVTRCHVGRTWT